MHVSTADSLQSLASDSPAYHDTPRRWPTGSRGALIHGLVLALLLPVSGIIIGTLLRPILPAPDSHPFDGSLGAFVTQGVRGVLGLVFIAVGLIAIGRLRWRDIGWREISAQQVALGVAGFVLILLAFAAFFAATTEYTMAGFFEAIAGQPWQVRLLGLIIGVSASLVEESLYRGYLQGSLCKRLGTGGGVAITAVLFSLMHFPGNLVAFGGRLIIGLGLGALRGKDRPLWAPAVAHTLIWVVIGAL